MRSLPCCGLPDPARVPQWQQRRVGPQVGHAGRDSLQRGPERVRQAQERALQVVGRDRFAGLQQAAVRRQLRQQGDQRLLHMHQDLPRPRSHLRQVTHEMDGIAQSLFRMQQDAAAFEPLGAGPLRCRGECLRKRAGEVLRLPPGLVRLPPRSEIAAQQVRHAQAPLQVGVVGVEQRRLPGAQQGLVDAQQVRQRAAPVVQGNAVRGLQSQGLFGQRKRLLVALQPQQRGAGVRKCVGLAPMHAQHVFEAGERLLAASEFQQHVAAAFQGDLVPGLPGEDRVQRCQCLGTATRGMERLRQQHEVLRSWRGPCRPLCQCHGFLRAAGSEEEGNHVLDGLRKRGPRRQRGAVAVDGQPVLALQAMAAPEQEVRIREESGAPGGERHGLRQDLGGLGGTALFQQHVAEVHPRLRIGRVARRGLPVAVRRFHQLALREGGIPARAPFGGAGCGRFLAAKPEHARAPQRPAASAARSDFTRAITDDQSPRTDCRYRRAVGYQGVSVRSSIQRQSGA